MSDLLSPPGIHSEPPASSAVSTSMAPSFETHRFAMLLWMRPETLMVRSAATPRVSNHEAAAEATMILLPSVHWLPHLEPARTQSQFKAGPARFAIDRLVWYGRSAGRNLDRR